MDQWKPPPPPPPPPLPPQPEGFFPVASNRFPTSCSQKVEHEIMDSITARKVQKADREKLRRDKLNEQFLELGKTLDPDRPKNDKATILSDTIQVLTDLTTQVNRLKAEYASLSAESLELTQEKNELREEKATLKSDMDNLNAQYQQRVRCIYPWANMDPSSVVMPPPYPFPMPVPIPSVGPIHSIHHQPLQPYPFFGNHHRGPCPAAYVPSYSSPHPQLEQSSTQHIPPHPHPHAHPHPSSSSSRSHTTSPQDSRSSKSTSERQQQQSGKERGGDDYIDVVTVLELKTPGSSAAAPSRSREATHDQGLLSCEEMKGRQRPPPPLDRDENDVCNKGSRRSRCPSNSSSSSSSNSSAGDGSVVADN